jgi:hypothetical protein
MQLRHEPAALLPAPSSRSAAQRVEMITITGIGDHLRPEWPITFTGIRTERIVRDQKQTREQRPITVMINVTAADASSFRASQGQIAAEMARAIDRASRNR